MIGAANALAFGPENRLPTVTLYDLLGSRELARDISE